MYYNVYLEGKRRFLIESVVSFNILIFGVACLAWLVLGLDSDNLFLIFVDAIPSFLLIKASKKFFNNVEDREIKKEDMNFISLNHVLFYAASIFICVSLVLIAVSVSWLFYLILIGYLALTGYHGYLLFYKLRLKKDKSDV